MATDKPQIVDMRTGLNTSVPDESHDIAFRTFQDVRTDSGSAKRRNGHVRVLRLASTDAIIDFDGTNDRVDTPASAPIQTLGETFTLEWLCKADTLSGNHYVIGKSGASTVGISVRQTSSNTMVVVVTDSGANTATLTATGITTSILAACQLVRSGANLTLTVNGTAYTGTIASGTTVAFGGKAAFGTDNGATFYDGRIEFVRGFSVARTSQMDGWSRLLNPRAPSVLFDYVLNETTFVRDRSLYENSASVTGSPATTSSLLSNNPVPIQAIAQPQATDGTRKVYIVGAGVVYPVTVA